MSKRNWEEDRLGLFVGSLLGLLSMVALFCAFAYWGPIQ